MSPCPPENIPPPPENIPPPPEYLLPQNMPPPQPLPWILPEGVPPPAPLRRQVVLSHHYLIDPEIFIAG